MRRLLYWYLPLAGALAGVILFGYGVAGFLRGDIGTPINEKFETTPSPAIARDEIRLLVLGDSLARGTGDASGLGIGGNLEQELARRGRKKRTPVNIAVNGARTGDLLEQLERPNVRHLVAESNVIVISIGGNDLFGDAEGRSAPPANPDAVIGRIVTSVQTAVAKVREANPDARIFLVGLYNPFAASESGKITDGTKQVSKFVNHWNAALMERFEGDPNFTLVQTADLFSHADRLSFDRFHPGEEAYRIIARRIAEGL